jgi:hypothetical protein
MVDDKDLIYQLETFRKENNADHKEILSKLTVLCTQVAIAETKVASIEEWETKHIQEHDDAEKSRWSNTVMFVLLGIGFLFELGLTIVGNRL